MVVNFKARLNFRGRRCGWYSTDLEEREEGRLHWQVVGEIQGWVQGAVGCSEGVVDSRIQGAVEMSPGVEVKKLDDQAQHSLNYVWRPLSSYFKHMHFTVVFYFNTLQYCACTGTQNLRYAFKASQR